KPNGTKISSVIFSFAFSSQELKKLGLGSEVDLQVYEVPVEYQTVQSLVPSLWKQYHPLLVVHVGVSGMTATVTLEKCGRNHGYKGLDNSSFCPDSQCCIVGGPDCIDSVLDIESVAKRVTASGLGVAVSVSKDELYYQELIWGKKVPGNCVSTAPQSSGEFIQIRLMMYEGAVTEPVVQFMSIHKLTSSTIK
uniref:Pyroglutamyl-peptidase I n=1 Tax=Sphaeramia orbicularis TaxID=375764 RepID=A0A672YWR6_9TELE